MKMDTGWKLFAGICGLYLWFTIPLGLFAQSVDERQQARMEIRTDQLEAYLRSTLLNSPMLESRSRSSFLSQLARELELIDGEQVKIHSREVDRQPLGSPVIMSTQQPSKANWFGINEQHMSGVLIRKRDRDRLNPQNWQITDLVEMLRNQDGLLTRLKVRNGQIPDTTVYITEYEYDERGYPLDQKFFVRDSIREHLVLRLRLHYDTLGRLERIREHRYSLMDSTLHDSVQTQFQYHNQNRFSVRVENGARGALHSDTTRITYQEGSGTEPLRLMIHRSELEEETPGGSIYRKHSWLRYTYPEMQTMMDFLSQMSNYYHLAHYQIDEYNPMSGLYREQFRVYRTKLDSIIQLSHQLWIQGGSWDTVEEVFVSLNQEGYPVEMSKYDASLGDLYLYENHEIESQEQETSVTPPSETPGRILLYQNYPNPFNPITQITFELLEPEWVMLNVYDALGRIVCTLADGVFVSGRHQVEFSGADLPSGQYYYRLEAGDVEITKTMTLAK